jgi:uncharacterized tellurite resistance protein B-like protein
MSVLEYFDHNEKRQKKDLFSQLVKVSKADGKIEFKEEKQLYNIGRRCGLTEEEIEKIIQNKEISEYIAPMELQKRFEHLYQVIKIVLADNEIDESEIKMVRYFAKSAHFTDAEIDKVLPLLLHGIPEGKDEEDLFAEYRKIRSKL